MGIKLRYPIALRELRRARCQFKRKAKRCDSTEMYFSKRFSLTFIIYYFILKDDT